MLSEVRVGLIGTSWWADLVHLPSVKSHPRAHLAAICGRNRARADEMAAKYGIPQVFTDYREMFVKGDLDAVVVAAPDDEHHPATMPALEAGLHVMCEKPLANNGDQARAMYEKAEQAGVKHGVFFTYPWLRLYRRMQELIDSGYVGRPYNGIFRFYFGWPRTGEYNWRFDAERSNGIVCDLGAHMIQFARLYFGDIAKVSAHLGTYIERSGAGDRVLAASNDAAVLVLEFANGAHGTIDVSAAAFLADRRFEQHVVLHGSTGTLESDFSFGHVELRGAHKGDASFVNLAKPDELMPVPHPFDVFFSQSAGDRLFVDAILEDRPFTPSFYDGWRVQQVIDAAIQSHWDGCWVAVPR